MPNSSHKNQSISLLFFLGLFFSEVYKHLQITRKQLIAIASRVRVETDLFESGLADRVVHNSQPLLVGLHLSKHRGPRHVCTRQLVCH